MGKSVLSAMAATALFLAPACAAAQLWHPGFYMRHPYMMADGGWIAMIFGPIVMLVPLILLIAAVVLGVRWTGGSWRAPPPRTPLDILKERFARGEIDKAEFEDRRRILTE